MTHPQKATTKKEMAFVLILIGVLLNISPSQAMIQTVSARTGKSHLPITGDPLTDEIFRLIESEASFDTLKPLIEKCSHVNASCKHTGSTLLTRAACRGMNEACKLLIEKGADIHAAENTGENALTYLAQRGTVDTVLLLIRKGADIRHVDKSGRTALLSSAMNKVSDVFILLIGMGADISPKTIAGDTAFTLAASGGHLNACKILMVLGADFRAVNNKGETTLICAADAGSAETCNYLMQLGVDPLARSEDGNDALLNASYHNKLIDVVQDLIDRGASCNTPNKNNYTPLMSSVQGGSLSCILLWSYGADFHARDKYERTALRYAAEGGHVEICKFLLQLSLIAPLFKNRGIYECYDRLKTALLVFKRYGCVVKVIPQILSSHSDLEKDFIYVLLLAHSRNINLSEPWMNILFTRLPVLMTENENVALIRQQMIEAQKSVRNNDELRRILEPTRLESYIQKVQRGYKFWVFRYRLWESDESFWVEDPQ